METKMNDSWERIMGMKDDDYIMRLTEVMRKTGLSRSSIYALLATKQFPQQINLSTRAVGWLASEVTAWLNERISARSGTNRIAG